MATYYEIPLSGTHQAFSISLGEEDYRLTFVYRDMPEAGWVMDIATPERVQIISGVPLITGADLLGQYRHLNIGGGGGLFVYTDGEPDAPPTFENLGTLSHLVWVPDA